MEGAGEKRQRISIFSFLRIYNERAGLEKARRPGLPYQTLSSAISTPTTVTLHLQAALSECPQIRPVGSSPDVRASTGPFLVWSLMSLPFPTALPWPGLEWAHLPDSCLLFALTLLTCFAQLSWPIRTCWPSVCPWCRVTISNLTSFSLFHSFYLIWKLIHAILTVPQNESFLCLFQFQSPLSTVVSF